MLLPKCVQIEITDDENGNLTYRVSIFGRVLFDFTVYDTEPK